jgi:transposase
MARPTKYDPQFCDEAHEFMSQGFSTKAFAGHIGVSLSTVYKWMDENEQFSEAIKSAQAAGAYWWEKTLMQVAATGQGNASAAIFGVKNRSQEEWKDKHDLDHTSSDSSMSPARTTLDDFYAK